MKKNFRGAIFDFDGVIVDSEPVRFQTYRSLVKKEFDIDIELSPGERIGFSENENLSYILNANGLQGDLIDMKQKRGMLLEKAISKKTPPVRSIHRIIDGLHRKNIPMAIASNSSERYMKKVLEFHVDLHKMSIFSAERISRPKPDPTIFLEAAQHLDVDPCECLVFEDSISGLTAARNAGMTSVGVLSTLDGADIRIADYILDVDDEKNEKMIIDLF